MSFFSGFKTFFTNSNFVEVAVAITVGVAFGNVIKAFVADFITPLLAAIGGFPDFSQLYFTLNNSKFLYGDFINVFLAFLILSFVIYACLVYPSSQMKKNTTSPCIYCKSEISNDSLVCKFCSSNNPVEQSVIT